jgi:hypothetical protein
MLAVKTNKTSLVNDDNNTNNTKVQIPDHKSGMSGTAHNDPRVVSRRRVSSHIEESSWSRTPSTNAQPLFPAMTPPSPAPQSPSKRLVIMLRAVFVDVSLSLVRTLVHGVLHGVAGCAKTGRRADIGVFGYSERGRHISIPIFAQGESW